MIKFKKIVQYRLRGAAESHSRTLLETRDLTDISDEPEVRGGTNEGFAPTEFVLAALVACSNVIAHKIAKREGVHFDDFVINAKADFNRMGVTLQEEVEVPFPAIDLQIEVTTQAGEAQLENVKRDLPRFCPVAKMLQQSGTTINTEWTIKRA